MVKGGGRGFFFALTFQVRGLDFKNYLGLMYVKSKGFAHKIRGQGVKSCLLNSHYIDKYLKNHPSL